MTAARQAAKSSVPAVPSREAAVPMVPAAESSSTSQAASSVSRA